MTEKIDHPELINADKLWHEVHAIGDCGAKPDTWADGWDKSIDAVIALIENAPVVDSETVSAHWNINCDGYYPFCSSCHEEPPGHVMTKYCPHCGARMNI